MIEEAILLDALAVAYDASGEEFYYNGGVVLLMKDSSFEIDHTRQQVWRGMASQISGIKSGDEVTPVLPVGSSPMKVLNSDPFGDYHEEVLIAMRDK